MDQDAPLERLRLVDFSDRELLLLMNDLAAEDGWVMADTVAQHIHIDHRNPERCVAMRFMWLARYGAVERELLYDANGNVAYTKTGRVKRGQRWRMTKEGAAIALGNLTATDRRKLDGFSEEQMLLVTRWLTTRVRTARSETSRTLTKREWRYGTDKLRAITEGGT